MRRVLVAAVLCWAAALSLAGHPALTGGAEAASRGTCSAHEDSPATPAQCRRAVRSARGERRAASGGALLIAVPRVREEPARVDDPREPPGDSPLARASLISSVTRAPRAPPRS